ncbi:uncharacterized protein LOC121863696 [Homarus americanus]|uniref:uncharacterized protein LOC121863696 n=1 Tax=Homarus americanus TaxID=6706 RepID=UPI001C46C06B|nr:uncharacterized protein LOC121863696 [Homarus americanus]
MVLVVEVLTYVWLTVGLAGADTITFHDGPAAGRLGLLPPILPDGEVTRGQVFPRHSRPHLDLPRPSATSRGLHDAPGTPRAGGQEGQPQEERNEDTQTTVTKKKGNNSYTQVVSTPQYARSKRKTRDLLPDFEPFPEHLGDLAGEGLHDQELEDDFLLLPLPYSSKWSRMEEKRSRSGRGRGHRRRHRVRHGKRRREKENSELLLPDSDLSFGSVLQEAQGKRTFEATQHHSHSQAPSYLWAVDDKATTENMVQLNQPSGFWPRVGKGEGEGEVKGEGEGEGEGEGPQKHKKPSMPSLSDPNMALSPSPPGPSAPGTPGALTTTSHLTNDSQGAPTTHHTVVSLLTNTTNDVNYRQGPRVSGEGSSTLRTPEDHSWGHKAVVNASIMQADEVTTAADDLHHHAAPSLATKAGNLLPNVTQKPQDSRRDPSESNKRQAIKLGSGARHPSQMNPGTALKNSEHYADPKLMMGPLTVNHSPEKHDNSISESLPTSENLSARQVENNRPEEGVKTEKVGSGEGRREETNGALRVVGSGPPLQLSAPHPFPHVSPGKAATDLRSGRGGAPDTTSGHSSSKDEDEHEDVATLQPSPKPNDVPSDDSTEDVNLHTLLPTASDDVFYPSSLPIQQGLRRAHSSLSTTDSPSGCYSTNDVVVVVFLTSLVNLVAFVLVTVMLCWCSLRGRLASPPPRPLHPDDHNDQLDDDVEEIVAPEGCLEACLPDISYQRHIARGSNLRPSFVVGRALRPLVHPHTPRLSHAVHELLHNLTGPTEEAHRGVGVEEEDGGERGRGEEEKKKIPSRKKSKPRWLKRRSLSLENLTLT